MPTTQKLLTAAAGSAGDDPLYVEDVFSTFVYAGQSTDLTITNGIDFSGKGGLFWAKDRGTAQSHLLLDTERGTSQTISSDSTAASSPIFSSKTVTYNSDGITLPGNSSVNPSGILNYQGYNNVGWSFRKAPKFFDVVTYTGNAVNGRQIAHNLGSTPGMIVVKRINGGAEWPVYHESTGAGQYLFLSTTDQKSPYDGPGNTNSRYWNNTAPTSTNFSVSNDGWVNASDGTYVAYLFASDAGGFGDDEDENIIKCGTYTGAGANLNINVGFEPQFVLIKSSSNATNWVMFDTMRGLPVDGNAKDLRPNTTEAEGDNPAIGVTSTGFLARNGMDGQINANGYTYIYMAIRMPMKTPEAGTEVFNIGTYGANRNNSSTSTYYAGFPVDMALRKVPVTANANNFASTRMLGTTDLKTNSTAAEITGETDNLFDSNTHWNKAAGTSSTSYSWMFQRATGFFDVVCYTGNATVGNTFTHNLGVVPEFIIAKNRDAATGWICYHKGLNGGTSPANYYILLNLTSAEGAASSVWNNTAPTSTTVTLGNDNAANGNGQATVAYLFASVAGVSKVGSYTGTGADLNVDCGFTGGARFILIKRTDATGDWYTYDSLRGIVAGNDPYLLLNSSAAEVTNTDYIDPLNAGFTVTSNASSTVNVNNGTYIFLAIA